MIAVSGAKAQLHKDGYVVLRDCLPVAPLDAINDEIAALFEIQVRGQGLPVVPGRTREALHANALRLLHHDVARYIATSRMTQELPSVARLLVGETIVDLVRELGIAFPIVSTKPSVHTMAEDLKIPGGYHKTPPHQDWRSIQGSLDNVVLWIPTTPVNADSHVLEVVPGSHTLGLLDTVEHIMTPTVNDPRITDDRFVGLPVRPGDVIVFSAFTVHRTGERGDGLARIALSTRFNNALEPTYVERGFTTPYKYAYRLDLMVPDFPRPEHIEALYGPPAS